MLIYKNKKLSYTQARDCMLSKLKYIMGNVNIGLKSVRSRGATAAVNELFWEKQGRWVSDLSKDGCVKDIMENRLSAKKKSGL